MKAIAFACLLAVGSACGPWGPQGIFAGGPLAGEEAGPVDASACTRETLTVAVETRRGWMHHAITVLCIAEGGALYIPSRHAPGKRWVQNAERDPWVRVGVGDRVYTGRAARVTEVPPGLAAAFLRKYVGIEAPGARFLLDAPEAGDDRAELWMFRIDPSEASP